jgi:hypothetical protein
MPKSKTRKKTNRRRKLAEKQRRLLLMTPEEIERADFSDDEVLKRIRELMEGIPLELRRKWAEEWREEHRRDP